MSKKEQCYVDQGDKTGGRDEDDKRGDATRACETGF